MGCNPRTHRRAFYVFAVLALLVALAIPVLKAYIGEVWLPGGRFVGAGMGAIYLGKDVSRVGHRAVWIPQHSVGPRLKWWFDVADNPGRARIYTVPLWVVSLSSAGIAAFFRRSERRAIRRAGGCLQCGYDRNGLAANAPCPECGVVP